MSRFMSRRRFAAAGAGVAVAIAGVHPSLRSRTGFGRPYALTFAQESQKATLALDWYPNANHAGIYMALNAGAFQSAGIDLDVFTPADPTTVLQTVGAGRDTFGISYQNDVLQARAKDVPVVSIAALVQHPLNCLMVLEDSGIEDPADLKGKTIAITGLPSDEAYVTTILEHVGLTMDDVEIVNVGYDILPALISGKADACIGAYWTHETILAEHEGHPARYFRVEEYGVPDYYELVVVASEDTVSTKPEMVTDFLGALQQGYTAAAADQGRALDVLVAASPDLVRDVEQEGLKLLAPLWTDDGKVAFGTQTAERWASYTTWAQENDLLDNGVDPAAAFTTDLLPTGAATPAATPM